MLHGRRSGAAGDCTIRPSTTVITVAILGMSFAGAVIGSLRKTVRSAA
jgi:hypothetical protein